MTLHRGKQLAAALLAWNKYERAVQEASAAARKLGCTDADIEEALRPLIHKEDASLISEGRRGAGLLICAHRPADLMPRPFRPRQIALNSSSECSTCRRIESWFRCVVTTERVENVGDKFAAYQGTGM